MNLWRKQQAQRERKREREIVKQRGFGMCAVEVAESQRD